MAKALIIVDVQVDFSDPTGSLYVNDGEEVAAKINHYVENNLGSYDVIVASKDYHIDPKGHFSDAPDYKDTWPPHCVAGTKGAEFHPNLGNIEIHLDGTFYKGLLTPAYSAFEGYKDIFAKWEAPEKFLSLDNYLSGRDVTELDICGIATDYCVYSTARDAVSSTPAYVQKPYRTRLLVDLCAGVSPDTTTTALNELKALGVELISEQL